MLKQSNSIKESFFKENAVETAKKLLGKMLCFKECSGLIVETEAYKRDKASHAYRITPRSKIMAETFGRVYVYFTYGMHCLLNFTCDENDAGAVLVRAVQPLKGIKAMKRKRKCSNLKSLCNGPAKLCQAFGITVKQNGEPIGKEIKLFDSSLLEPLEIVASERIGISKEKDKHLLWRFYVKGNKFVSSL